jgi:hypothetical protein
VLFDIDSRTVAGLRGETCVSFLSELPRLPVT